MDKILKYFSITVAFLGILFVCVVTLVAIYIGANAEKDTRRKSDIILVLGARSYIDGKYNPCLKARIEHATELYRAGYAPKMLFSGGYDTEDHVNESETMMKIAEEQGVPAHAILLENASTSTYENFVDSQKILSRNHIRTVIIVTEPFHMPRASLVAEKLGFSFTISPALYSPCWVPNKYLSKYFLKEPFAIVGYKMEGKL